MNYSSEKIEVVKLADQVAAKLQQLIASGEYKKGDKIPTEPELMARFGVGRSTVRESVRILANAGLVTVQQGKGTFVQDANVVTEPLHQRLRRANTKELNEVRHMLEITMVQKAAENRTEKEVKQMRTLLSQRKKAIEEQVQEECLSADIAFHVVIAEASKNPVLIDLYKTFAKVISDYFQTEYPDTKAYKRSQGLHEKLCEAIANKESKKAGEYMSQILSLD
ncbi:FadR/GntR family transcriptional regulator [Cytophaga aurantiaca]|uniref:FadR/GntR family transcriptional regulator n=1 Tax=Cytophaga aurantiaca TaxID=29530 RepID=UPI0003769BFC|nr:FadR/GntR family transcriptional regulator [Cytophaga aurantiaca]